MRACTARIASLILISGLAAAGCVSERATTPDVDAAAERQAEIERLRALGYVDYTAEPVDPEDSGVTVARTDRIQPGYNLYTVRRLGLTEVRDVEGELVHSWSEPAAEFWSRSLLLPRGDLLVVGAQLPERYVLRSTWDNDTLWRHALQAHHDIRPTPDGSFITLTMHKRMIPTVDVETPVRDNALTIFASSGDELERISLHDVIAASPDILPLRTVKARKGDIDLIHANSIRFMDDEALEDRHPLYEDGNLLVCMRNQDAIAVIDPETEELVWAWGRGELEGPHDATILGSGNILIFDNGTRRRWSRVVEIDPLAGEIVWEYRAPAQEDFFTASRGGAQRLANGNTLVTESNEGRAFEVTPDGEIVWEFFVPHLDGKGRRATIIRLYRYPAEMIEPRLDSSG